MPREQEAKADTAFTAFANTVGIRSLPLGSEKKSPMEPPGGRGTVRVCPAAAFASLG